MHAHPTATIARYGRALGAVLCALAMLCPLAARADDTSTPDLGAIDAVTLGISQITPDGVQCGLDPARLLQVARQALADSGILLRDDTPTRLTLSTITTRDAAAPAAPCATATMLGVYHRESFLSAQTGWLQNGFVVLWQRSLLLMTPTEAHASGVASSVRRIVAQFLADREAQRHRGPVAENNPTTGHSMRQAEEP